MWYSPKFPVILVNIYKYKTVVKFLLEFDNIQKVSRYVPLIKIW